MAGNPPNIIIGTAFGYTFMDFADNTGLIAWAGMLLSVGYFYMVSRKALTSSQNNGDTPITYPEPREAITNPLLFRINLVIFILVVTLIVTHANTGISVALIGVIAAVMTLLSSFKNVGHVIKEVDWRTLLFFIGLFIAVGGLEETGLLKMLAYYIGDISGGNILILIPVILWVSAITSAIVDNIPFAAVMVPVIRNLSMTAGLKLPTLAWTLALGADIGGNATPIGASANVVGTAISAKEGYPISWARFCKYAIPATILVVGLSWLLLLLRYA